jgi:hypothetical protein
MASDPPDLDNVISEFVAAPVSTTEIRVRVPAAAGLYA